MRAVVWLVYAVINIALAWSNNRTRLARLAAHNNKQIEHAWYAAGYVGLCLVPGLHHWWLFCSLILQHISIFPIAWNYFYGNPAFYLSRTTSSRVDRFMVWIGLSDTAIVNILSLIISIIIARL